MTGQVNGSLIVAMVGLLSVISYQQGLLNKTSYTVERIIDGDTFETTDKTIVRFDTLDAPELKYCGGPEAKAALEKILKVGSKVQLTVEARDVSGRQVASVWQDGVWIDQKLIETGWVAYASSTVDKEHILKTLDAKNKDQALGIYSQKCTQYENKDKPTCVIKGNIVGEWVNKGQKVYHVPGCIQYNSTRIEKYRGEEWFCTENQAQAAGYTKSGGCPHGTI